VPDHPWIQPQARIIEEHLAVDIPDINAHSVARSDGLHCASELEREPQVFRKMVERTERQHAEDHFCPNERGSHGVDGAIAPPGNDELAALTHRTPRQRADLRPTPSKSYAGGYSLGLEESIQLLWQVFRGSGVRTSQGIEDDVHRRRHHEGL
jgi:hypothetical protein